MHIESSTHWYWILGGYGAFDRLEDDTLWQLGEDETILRQRKNSREVPKIAASRFMCLLGSQEDLDWINDYLSLRCRRTKG
jgi:hypothetical protein